MSSEDYAIFSGNLPVNSRPFLTRMNTILENNDCTSPRDLPEHELNKFKSNLWMVMYQTFNTQLGDIRMFELWRSLNDKL